jgi:hypothetical protein
VLSASRVTNYPDENDPADDGRSSLPHINPVKRLQAIPHEHPRSTLFLISLRSFGLRLDTEEFEARKIDSNVAIGADLDGEAIA